MSTFKTKRMWMLRRAQRKIRAPGVHPPKRHECAATDWRTGKIVRIRTEKRNAKAFCHLAEKCMTRSARRKRPVSMVVERAQIHTPEGSRLVAELLNTYGRRLRLRYVPSYSPECMPMETFWNDWRNPVTHIHDRLKLKDLQKDSDGYFARCARHPDEVL